MNGWQNWLRKPRTVWLRRAFFQLHLWIGLAIGLYVVLLSITGSALVFRREMDRAFRPEAPSIEGREFMTRTQLTQAARAAYPEATVEKVGDPQGRSALVRVYLTRDGEQIERDFNGYTGEDLGDPFPWKARMLLKLVDLHDDLLMLEDRRGRWWNGVGSILVLVVCITGAVLWWRGLKVWRKGFAFSWRSPWPRLNFDLHSALGFWFFAIVGIWALSGIYLAFPDPFSRAVDRIWGPLDAWQYEPRPGDDMLAWLVRLHFGRWQSHTLKVVWVIIGLVPAVMFITGGAMWWYRVVRKRPLVEDNEGKSGGDMERRNFLKSSVMAGAGLITAGSGLAAAQNRAPAIAARRPIRMILSGYAPANNGFSLALKRIGDRLTAKFKGDVDVKYVYNILDLGYRGEDILWLVESGVLTLGYQSSSYLTERVPDLGIADLPFLFRDTATARAAMDGKLGAFLAQRIEAGMDFRILGWFENGFRHISNRVRPVRTPADLKGLTIRVLPSKVQERTFQLLGATPKIMDLSEVMPAVKAGTLDAQENPFLNTVTYGVHNFHKFHTASNHFYLSRPIFLHRASFDAWPKEIQDEMRAAVKDAMAFQRDLHVKEEIDSMVAIRKVGGEILELTPEQSKAFQDAVRPIYGEARSQYSKELLALAGM